MAASARTEGNEPARDGRPGWARVGRPRAIRLVRALRLIHPFPTVLNAVAAVALAAVAVRGWPGTTLTKFVKLGDKVRKLLGISGN